MRRTILAVISDTHAGNTGGLLNPNTTLYAEDEEGNPYPWQPELNASQRYLWELYTENIRKVEAWAAGDEVVVLHTGDECQGDKYKQLLVSTRLSDQIEIAYYNLLPWYDLPNLKAMRVVAGTQAHNFGEGSAAVLVAKLLAKEEPRVSTLPLYHGLLTVNGVVVDYAHHGPHPGSRDWLKGNVARYYLRDLMTREIKKRRRPPDLVLRGHFHTPVHEYLEDCGYASRLFILPSYCMIGDHGRQVTRSQYEITHGTLAFEIVDGRIVGEKRLYKTIDIRTKETL
jgi:hypothetical protein